MNHLRLLSALGATACMFGASAALADTHWVVTGTFSDSTTVSGYVDLNIYGFLSGYDLMTQGGVGFPNTQYTTGGSISADRKTVNFGPATSDLHLVFAAPLTTPGDRDDLLTSSYECQGSYSCFIPSGGATRYIVSGFASAPEPASWALMLIGVAGLGLAVRRRRTLVTA